MQVRMTDEWDTISAKVNASTYGSDYEFQLDISKLYSRLNDAHTHCKNFPP